MVNQSRPSLCALSRPVRARSRRWEALRPESAAASRNDSRSSAKAASEQGKTGASIGGRTLRNEAEREEGRQMTWTEVQLAEALSRSRRFRQ